MSHAARHTELEFDEDKIDIADFPGMREMFRRFIRSLETQLGGITRKLSGATTGDEAVKRAWML